MVIIYLFIIFYFVLYTISLFLYYFQFFPICTFGVKSKFSTHCNIFIYVIIVLNAQTNKIQYDAMVYMCLSKDLLIFKHE
jgi:hypothetical protein